MYYAIVKGTEVVNYIEWNGVTEWAPPEGCIAVADPEGKGGIGYTYDGHDFYPPVPNNTEPRRDPVDTLKDFLSNHPDVMRLLDSPNT